MLNKIILMGRLTRDPELRRTESGTAVCSFSIAVDRDFKSKNGEKETDFIDIVAWRATAEFVSKYFQKGSLIAIEGSLQSRQYQDKTGANVTEELLLVSNDQAAHNAFSDLVHTVQLSGEAGLAGEVDHGVDAFLLVVDGVGQTALAPLVDGIDRTVSLDQGLELTHQSGGSLLIESGAGNQHGFVLCHFCSTSFWT